MDSCTEQEILPEAERQVSQKQKLFVIAHSFPPATTPAANRSSRLLQYLKPEWSLEILTGMADGFLDPETKVEVVQGWTPDKLYSLISKLKLEKFWKLLVWPDDNVFWLFPAIRRGYQLIKQSQANVIVVFIMPYSAALAGIVLKWMTGLPLVINLGDSLTCTDMHPSHPTWFHYQMNRWLEDFYIRQCDAIVYVSQRTINRVKSRQPAKYHSKFHLSRGGIDLNSHVTVEKLESDNAAFNIVYTGGMNGWYQFYDTPSERVSLKGKFKALYQAWLRLGRYSLTTIDFRSSSPVFVGKAVNQIVNQCTEWHGKIHVKVYGNQYPKAVVKRVLENENIDDIVSVFDRIPNHQAIQIAQRADMLFLTLPERPDGSESCRISLKTYEYLMTDCPILAAVPKGENWDYLTDKPGVWLVDPTDTNQMSKVIEHLAKSKFEGQPQRFDRSHLYEELSYEKKAQDFSKLLSEIVSKRKLGKS